MQTIELPTGAFDVDHIKEEYDYFKGDAFKCQNWYSRPALVSKDGKTSSLYTGQSYDATLLELVDNAWKSDDCSVCTINISEEGNNLSQTSGYFNGYNWICKWCFENIISADNIDKRIMELQANK